MEHTVVTEQTRRSSSGCAFDFPTGVATGESRQKVRQMRVAIAVCIGSLREHESTPQRGERQ